MTDDAAPDPDESTEDASPAPVLETVHGVPITWSHGDRVLHATPDQMIDLATALRAEGCVSILDLTGVDYLTHMGRVVGPGITAERFELVITFMNHDEARRTRVRVQVPESNPVVPSLFDIYPGTEAAERETWDMYGITFDGNPDPTRILMPDGWEGHPLRKDYAIGSVPVQFKGAPTAK